MTHRTGESGTPLSHAASGVPDRVAIVMLTAIGDAVHVLPLIASLRAANPRCRITWILQPGPYELVKGLEGVDFIVFDRRRGWRAYLELRRTLGSARFDLVLALQDYLKAGLITAMLRADRKVGIDRERARDVNWLFTTERIAPRAHEHVQDLYLEFLDHLGVPRVMEWAIGSDGQEAERYRELLSDAARPIVALVVGTSRREKEWPVERYVELVTRLSAEGRATVALVGGLSERETETAGTIQRHSGAEALDLRAWDLRRLVYLLEQADVLVSPDTGPLHMAVALRTPSVALMGYTNPKRYGPYRRFPDLIADGFGEPGEEYSAAAARRSNRMERIGVEMVMQRVRWALERYPRPDGSAR